MTGTVKTNPWVFAALLCAAPICLLAEERALDFSLLPTIQYAHREMCARATPELPPPLAATAEIVPGQRLDLLPLVRNFKLDADGKAHVTYRLTIHRPDGRTETSADHIAIEKLAADPRGMIFPTQIAQFTAAGFDPAGEYRFEMAVRDHVANASATKSVTVRVNASDGPLAWPADADARRLLVAYYRRPEPRLALPMLNAYSRDPAAQARPAAGQGAMLGFYEQVLAENPWLVGQFKQHLATTKDKNERRFFAMVLAYAMQSDAKFGDDLPRTAKAAYVAAGKEPLPIPTPEPKDGGQLDALWGRFLASGRFQPIADLVAVVDVYLPHRGKLAAYKNLQPKPKSAPPEVFKDAVLGSAIWSLGSNAFQHKLVRAYLTSIEQSADTRPEVKAVLREALAWTPPASGADSPAP